LNVEHHEHRDVIEGLRQAGKGLTARAAEMEKIADAAKPLYDSLDDAQKRRFGMLLHAIAQMHGHHGHWGMHHDGRSDDHEDGEHSE